MKIAVIGSGVAGNAAAYLLADRHQVTVYEKDVRAGGHAHTVDVDYDGETIAVDTGFIVYNTLNYPHLTGLFAHLGVETIESDMSFSVSCGDGRLEWSGQQGSLAKVLASIFAQKRNVANPRFLMMLRDMGRFNLEAPRDRAAGALAGLSLGDYLAAKRFSAALIDDYIVPMGAAIWSTPVDQMLRFPAENFIAFFENHRLLHWNRPRWRTVKGGSRTYVEAMVDRYRDRIRLGCAATAITRHATHVAVRDGAGASETYDQVILATHSDETLALLADPTEVEREVLGAIRYRDNDVYLHRDAALMPRRRRAWAAWNFLRGGGRGVAGGDVAITYWMNALQAIDPARPLFVSLNPPRAPDPALTFRRFSYAHPQYDLAAFAAQKRVGALQGERRTWFCGAWTGYGFHEDGLRSAVDVAARLGVGAPWTNDVAPLLAEAAE